MATLLTFPAAETLGFQALAFLAGDDGRLERLQALSGLSPADLKTAAGDPHLLAAILAFLLGNEPLLLEFCGENSIKPALVHAAQHVLEGGCA